MFPTTYVLTEKNEMTAMLETRNEVFVENYLFGIA